jgi:hypothetical protein
VVDALRRGRIGDLHELAQRHHLSSRRADIEAREIAGRGAVLLVRLDVDAVGARAKDEVVDVRRAHVDLQRGEHLVERDAEGLGPLAIDLDDDLRIVRGERGEDAA